MVAIPSAPIQTFIGPQEIEYVELSFILFLIFLYQRKQKYEKKKKKIVRKQVTVQ